MCLVCCSYGNAHGDVASYGTRCQIVQRGGVAVVECSNSWQRHLLNGTGQRLGLCDSDRQRAPLLPTSDVIISTTLSEIVAACAACLNLNMVIARAHCIASYTCRIVSMILLYEHQRRLRFIDFTETIIYIVNECINCVYRK